MKKLLLSVMISAALPTFADTFNVAAPVSRATLYTNAAVIERTASIDLPAGEHTLLIPKALNDSAQATQIQLTGAELISQSLVPGSDFTPSATEDKRRTLSITAANIKAQIASEEALIKGLADSLATHPENLSEVQSQTSALGQSTAALRKELAATEWQLATLPKAEAPQTPATRQLIVAVKTPGTVTLTLTTQSKDAHWQPQSQITLDTKAQQVQLTAYADITQKTPLNWQDVALTLAITPQRYKTIPALYPRTVNAVSNAPRPQVQMLSLAAKSVAVDGAERAAVVQQGSDFMVVLPHKVSLEADASAQQIPYFSQTVKAAITRNIYAWTGLDAMLVGKWQMPETLNFLPGEMRIVRDGIDIATRQSRELWQAGTAHSLSFGIDPQIKVERAENPDVNAEKGLISKSNVDRIRNEYVLRNLGDTALPVAFYDRLPVSQNEAIRVVPNFPELPSETDVDKVKGILRWDHLLEKGRDWTLHVDYDINYPTDMKIHY